MPITALPTPPTRTDPANFAARGDAFLTALLAFVTEANALETNVNAKEVSAAASAAAALVSQGAAAQSEINATNNGAAQVALAAAQVALAVIQANAASASALTALNAPGTSATSATSLAVGIGSKTLTIQAGKSIVVGMSVKVASTASPTNWMYGDVTAYNAGTGLLTFTSSLMQGSGTIADWTVSLAGPASISANWKILTVADNGYNAQNGERIKADTSGGAFTINLPATPAAGWWVEIADGGASWGTNALTVGRNGSTIEDLAENMACHTTRDGFVMAYIGTTWRQ